MTILFSLLLFNWFIAFFVPLDGKRKGGKFRKRKAEEKDTALVDLVDAIYSRRATNSKDLAFGLEAVLSILMKRDLPPPDYSKSLSDIYREFTVHLFEATGALYPLLPAALTEYSGQPSWVPDWQADLASQKFWLRPIVQWSSISLGDTNKGDKRQAHQFKVDTQKKALTVRGREICRVTSLLEFQETEDVYNEAEGAIHLKNIGMMLGLYQTESGIKLANHLFDRQSHSSPCESLTTENLLGYKEFLFESRRMSPSNVFKIIKFGSLMEAPFRKFFRKCGMGRVHASFGGALEVHIWLCNSMARTDRRIFHATNLALNVSPKQSKSSIAQDLALGLRTFKEYAASRAEDIKIVGICTAKARVGDTILLLSGLHVPLVVRPDASCHRLVSPAILECRVMGDVGGPTVLEGDLNEFILS
jgi:hypothetical protein